MSGSVTLFVRLRVIVTADPPTIRAGQVSQLNADAKGGSPPYTYTWTPADTLNDFQASAPVATPVTTTTYNVVVRDSVGAVVNGSATVTVTNVPLTASFTYRIGSNQTLVLDASASTGNIVSYIWDLSWTPANPDLVTTSPFASIPVQETDFGTITLTVVDAAGNTATTSRPF